MKSSAPQRSLSRFSTLAPLCSEETEEEEEEGSMLWSMLCGTHLELEIAFTSAVMQPVVELAMVAVEAAVWLVYATLELVLSSP
jgi:hypothetical protein